MTNIQLYLSIGIPAFIVAFGMLFNGLLFQSVSARMVSLEQSLSARMSSLEQSFNSRITSLEERFHLLEGAIHELDKRLTALEVRLEGR